MNVHKKPADGRAYATLLVGTSQHPAFVTKLKAQLLAEFGCDVRWHWDEDGSYLRKTIPSQAEVVVVISEHLPRHVTTGVSQNARAAGARYALVGFREASVRNGMTVSGFTRDPVWLQPVPAKRPDPMSPLPKEPQEEPESSPAPKPAQTQATPPAAEEKPSLALVPLHREMPRFVALGSTWSEKDITTLVRLAERAVVPGFAEVLVETLWRETGTYRTPATIVSHLRATATFTKVTPEAINAVDQLRKQVSERKARRVKDDRALRGLAVLKVLENRGLDPRAPKLVRSPREWEEHLLVYLSANGPQTKNNLVGHSELGSRALASLVLAGRVIQRLQPGTSVTFNCLDGQEPPEKKLPPPKAAHQAPAATAQEPELSAGTASAYRAFAQGLINATQLAEVLRALGKEQP